MATALSFPRTLDEFLAWETRQPERWEFVDGQLRLMAGGTVDHARIATNILAALRPKLRGSGCEALGSDLKVLVRATKRSFYPDVTVRCGRPASGRDQMVDDPVILFEVLSEGTAEYDLTTKRRSYLAIPGLRQLVYVSQDKPHVYVLSRDAEGRWVDDDLEGMSCTLDLGPLDAHLSLAEIYEDTTVGSGDAR